MATKVIIRSDSDVTYDDLSNKKITGKLLGQTDKLTIRRKKGSAIEAVLVKKSWFDSRVSAFEAASAPLFSKVEEVRSDDHIGINLHSGIDLLRGRVQVPRLSKRVISEGLSSSFLVYALERTDAYYADNSPTIPRDEGKVGGEIIGYLLHPAHEEALSSSPQATTYSGTGNGTISEVTSFVGQTITEDIEITATSATEFSVVGASSGALGTATVGTKFVSPQISFLLAAGATPFVAGDKFTVKATAANI